MLRWAFRGDARGSLLALYVLVALSLVLAHRCLRLGPQINQQGLAALALAKSDAPLPSGANGAADARDRGGKLCEASAVVSDWRLDAQKLGMHVGPDAAAALAGIPDDSRRTARRAANGPENVRSRAPPDAVLES